MREKRQTPAGFDSRALSHFARGKSVHAHRCRHGESGGAERRSHEGREGH
jgi:hypothetical protein